jgi:hypothetical protein
VGVAVKHRQVRIESFGMTKVSMLEDGVGLPLAVISQVEVGCVIIIHLHFLSLWFGLHFFLFFLFFFVVHHARAW